MIPPTGVLPSFLTSDWSSNAVSSTSEMTLESRSFSQPHAHLSSCADRAVPLPLPLPFLINTSSSNGALTPLPGLPYTWDSPAVAAQPSSLSLLCCSSQLLSLLLPTPTGCDLSVYTPQSPLDYEFLKGRDAVLFIHLYLTSP